MQRPMEQVMDVVEDRRWLASCNPRAETITEALNCPSRAPVFRRSAQSSPYHPMGNTVLLLDTPQNFHFAGVTVLVCLFKVPYMNDLSKKKHAAPTRRKGVGK